MNYYDIISNLANRWYYKANVFDIYRGPVHIGEKKVNRKVTFTDYAINNNYVEIYVDGVWLPRWDEAIAAAYPITSEYDLTLLYLALFRSHTVDLESVPAIEVLGILVDVAHERGAVIQVKTRSGMGYNTQSPPGVLFARMRGYTVPDTFYTPRYYPKLAIDQLEYDFRNTYLWKPEVITNSQGEAELSFPVGFWPGRSLQIVVEGTDRAGGMGMVQQRASAEPQ